MPDNATASRDIIFSMDAGNRQLFASVTQNDAPTQINPERLKLLLSDQGYGRLFVFGDAFDRLIELHNAGSETRILLAERRDGSCSITLSADLMQAYLSITPNYGGTPATRELVDKALAEQGVIFGIDADACDDAVAKGAVTNLPVAAGVPPIPGENSQFVSLIRESASARWHTDDEAIIDYRSFSTIITVKQGDPVMRRLPATDGIPGTNILGMSITAPGASTCHFPQRHRAPPHPMMTRTC